MTIKQQFKSAIRRGTGEALLIIKKNPALDFSKYILDASLKNYAYDAQCEGSRAIYLKNLIELSGKTAKIVAAILHKLVTNKEADWDLYQLFELAKEFAKDGNETARKAMYKRLRLGIKRSYAYDGEYQIIAVDGFEGLNAVMEVRGKILDKYPDTKEDEWLLKNFRETHPEINLEKELKRLAKQNAHIKKYVAVVKETEAKQRKYKTPVWNYDAVKERIEQKLIVTPLAAKQLKTEEIKQLAEDFLQEKDVFKQEKYLRIFAKIKFPGDYHYILDIAKGPGNKKLYLIHFAVRALEYFTASDIRGLAIEKIINSREPALFSRLLTNNYKKGDHKLLTEIAAKYKNEDIIEDLALAYTDIYKKNPTKDCKAPLEILYGKMTCGLCREDVVKTLLSNGVLSKKIKAELYFDANEDLRALARNNFVINY